jgi:hypothetical protein
MSAAVATVSAGPSTPGPRCEHSPAAADCLRKELIESQKAKTDYLKWKLFLIAALAVAGFGLYRGAGQALPVALGLIPFACAYVDALCIHNDIRMLAIGEYLKHGGQEPRGNNTSGESGRETQPPDPYIRDYEMFCEKRRWMFCMESIALFWTSLAAPVLVYFAADEGRWATLFTYCKPGDGPDSGCTPNPMNSTMTNLLHVTSVAGLIMIILLYAFKQALIVFQIKKKRSPHTTSDQARSAAQPT